MSDDYFGHLQFNTNPTCLIHRMFWLSHWYNISISLRLILKFIDFIVQALLFTVYYNWPIIFICRNH